MFFFIALMSLWIFNYLFWFGLVFDSCGLQKHKDSGADVTVSCVPMDDSRASDYGLMKIDGKGQINYFKEKPKGDDLQSMVRDDWSFENCEPLNLFRFKLSDQKINRFVFKFFGCKKEIVCLSVCLH